MIFCVNVSILIFFDIIILLPSFFIKKEFFLSKKKRSVKEKLVFYKYMRKSMINPIAHAIAVNAQ